MPIRLLSNVSLILFLLAGSLSAQEMPEFPKPTKEHEWLQQFVGEWKSNSKCEAGPDMPAMECSGKISSRMLGGFWVINEMTSDLPGMSMMGIQKIGYDPTKKKYVGTWVDSMTSHLWIYEGTVDETGKILTLEAEGPNFMAGGEMAKFQDIYEFKSKDELAITSRMLGPDNKWIIFMQGTGKRVK